MYAPQCSHVHVTASQKSYPTKNNWIKGEFSRRVGQLASRLQTWRRSIALRAADETWNGDPLLTQIIKDNSKVIDEHILFIRKVEPQDLEDICRHPQFAEEAQHLQNLCSAYPIEIHKHDARCTILACAESLRKKLRRDKLKITRSA